MVFTCEYVIFCSLCSSSLTEYLHFWWPLRTLSVFLLEAMIICAYNPFILSFKWSNRIFHSYQRHIGLFTSWCVFFFSLYLEIFVSNNVCIVGQDDIVSRGVNGISSVLPSKQKDVLNSDMKHLVLANEHFRAQSLRSSMDNLNKEVCISHATRICFCVATVLSPISWGYRL